MIPKVQGYIFGGMQRVPGYLGITDALILTAIARIQAEAGVRGAVAEIGVLWGRLFYLLSMLRQAGEGAFAADLFTRPSQRETFESRGRELDLPLAPESVFVGDTAGLKAGTILNAVGAVRLFSIDGGHALHHIANDAAIADGALAPRGVIAFDDFCNAEWPEVSVGIIDFLRANSGYATFCVSNVKLYVCRRDQAEAYAQAVLAAPELTRLHRKRIGFLGDQPVLCRAPRRIGLGAELLAHVGLPGLAWHLYRPEG